MLRPSPTVGKSESTMSDLTLSTEPESKSELAYQQLRALIVHLELAPGDVLREDELQDTIGIGAHTDPRSPAATRA